MKNEEEQAEMEGARAGMGVPESAGSAKAPDGKKGAPPPKIALYGFNNLTKSLSFNIYDICYAGSVKERQEYLAYIDEQYNSARLTDILCGVTERIGAHILNISKQDYDPQGASVNILIAEADVPKELVDPSNNLGNVDMAMKPTFPEGEEEAQGGVPQIIHAHLDKSHVTVHTFPESHPDKAISTFRVDLDVSTCGKVSPLSSLDYLIKSFDSDIITIDYRVRGFTRDNNGKKYFLDQSMASIQDHISDEILQDYFAVDMNMYQANLFHTRLMLKDVDLQSYLFNLDAAELRPAQRLQITEAIQKEMIDIYSGMNVYDE